MNIRKGLVTALPAVALLSPFSAFAGMGYNMNGYSPNSSSPVIGGWAQVTVASGRYCKKRYQTWRGWQNRCQWGTSYTTYYRPFGDINLNGGGWKPGGSWVGSVSCPNNTANIKVSKYLADNGVWYNSVYVPWYWHGTNDIHVCVDTDTGQGWYGGQ